MSTFGLSIINDRLRIASVTWDVKRNDELSGMGDGRVWQAELAPPLWTATINLATYYTQDIKEVAAVIRSLQGAQNQFLLVDPISKYPARDPTGSILGNRTVRLNTINANRRTVSLRGLPSAYRLTLGDKIQINYGADPERYAFHEVSRSAVADADGYTGTFDVFPNLPIGISESTVVTLLRPALRCIVVPGSHDPGTAYLDRTEGATFKVLQKR